MKKAKRPSTYGRLDESLLNAVPPFSKLDPKQIRTILDLASSRRYAAGVSVFEEGHDADRFYLLLDGYIRVVRITADGEQVIVLHIPSGQLFGIAKALGRNTYPATAIAATDSIALSWPTRLWEGFIAQYDGFATETYQTLGTRIAEMNNRIVEMATQQVEQRIACALLRLINQTGRKVDLGIEIDFPITRQDISEMTGTTLHTVSRMMSAWGKQGFIESGRKRIIVRDHHQIVVLSGGKV
ncbi:putative cyclic nucleotide-binding protein [Octadecabacter antarcticus 307]|uniref:Putative cyclic nucleotide-binding protein n=1 Tax=Octadecabacter antarcticus 307 TaxID=391626 RepID=M9R826_9RHOB|nr:Crp/Fnr family transcriptional regulator [Octadecabacter antarcticus]AGI66451.1 putative cyclic nucleotide-binding protein [Octadecabacter antarcticus 307]